MTTPSATSIIVAQAFRFMEVTPPSSLDDDTEKAAAAREQYEIALRMCLEAADWSFASTLVNLPLFTPPETTAADPNFPYSYSLPGDLVRLHEVGDGSVRWRRDAVALRADQTAPLQIRYTSMITNEAALPATFQIAVALQLALLLGPRWLTTNSKMDGLAGQHSRAISEARRQDARMAASARYDGLDDHGDWVAEARA